MKVPGPNTQPKVTGTVWKTSLSCLVLQAVPCSGTLMPVFRGSILGYKPQCVSTQSSPLDLSRLLQPAPQTEGGHRAGCYLLVPRVRDLQERQGAQPRP